MQKILLALMLSMLALPLPITLLLGAGITGPLRWFAAEPVFDLNGPSPPPRPTIANVRDGVFQRAVEPWFGTKLAPHGAIVRATNQLYYSAFQRSFANDRGMIVGRQGTLYDVQYLRDYCEPHPPGLEARLAPLLTGLQELQLRLAIRRIPMLLVVTPSKAVATPEFFPTGACQPSPAPARRTATFVSLANAAGIHVLDGPALTRAMKERDPLPPFPRGGMHWSVLVGQRVAGQVMQELNRQFRSDMGSVSLGATRWDLPPNGRDADLARLLNLLWAPTDYKTASAALECHTTDDGQATRLVAVGGSFLGVIFDALYACGLFKSVTQYFYYTQYGFNWPSSIYYVNRKGMDWRTTFSQRTALVVEINELYIDRPVPHLEQFLDDALAALR